MFTFLLPSGTHLLSYFCSIWFFTAFIDSQFLELAFTVTLSHFISAISIVRFFFPFTSFLDPSLNKSGPFCLKSILSFPFLSKVSANFQSFTPNPWPPSNAIDANHSISFQFSHTPSSEHLNFVIALLQKKIEMYFDLSKVIFIPLFLEFFDNYFCWRLLV